MKAKFFTKLIKAAFAGLLIVSLVGVISCQKTDEPCPIPPVPQPAKYTINGTVFNRATNAALPGVLVTMGTLTQTTSATGTFQFANLTTAGKYNLVLTKSNFFPAAYSIEFPIAGPDQTIIYNLTATMEPFVPGVTPLDPLVGGVVPIIGGIPATLTIPAGTTVKDANNVTVTGSINITLVSIPDVVIPNTTHYPGVLVFSAEPAGYQFSNPLPLAVDNLLTTNYKYSELQLESFNPVTRAWEIQTQAVTYDIPTNDYLTTIKNFSFLKISLKTAVTQAAPVSETIEVIDYAISNTSLVSLPVSAIRYKSKSGYLFVTPVLTALSTAGITGADATAIATQITDVIKKHYNGTPAVSQFAVISATETIDRTVQSQYELLVGATQKTITEIFTIKLTKLSDSTVKTVTITTRSADIVTLQFADYSLATHAHYHGLNHGLGGGGTL